MAAEMAVKVTSDALQIHGASGYATDFPLERLYRDARVYPIFEGTSQIQRIRVHPPAAAWRMSEPIGPLGLRVGQRARRTQTVTARDVELYAEITGDRNPLHFDADFAARTRFGRLVAQGGIASGMLNALVAMDLPGAGTVFMSQILSYRAPTYLGDQLTAEVEVLSLKPDK